MEGGCSEALVVFDSHVDRMIWHIRSKLTLLVVVKCACIHKLGDCLSSYIHKSTSMVGGRGVARCTGAAPGGCTPPGTSPPPSGVDPPRRHNLCRRRRVGGSPPPAAAAAGVVDPPSRSRSLSPPPGGLTLSPPMEGHSPPQCPATMADKLSIIFQHFSCVHTRDLLCAHKRSLVCTHETSCVHTTDLL